MRFVFCTLFLLTTILIKSQNPFPLQVSIPVYFENVAYSYLKSDNAAAPLGSLCGISLMFLDTSKVQEEIIVSGLEDPIIWFDKVGISTTVRFIVSDSFSQTSMDFLFANNACRVNIIKNNQNIANGSIAPEFGGYSLRLVGDNSVSKDIVNLLEKLNDYLLSLHTKVQKTIPISPLFARDSLNLIFGYDYSYNTNYDLFWFDETLRNRIKNLALKSLFVMESNERGGPISESLQTNAIVHHEAIKTPGKANRSTGKVSTIFKISGDKNYLFLKAQQEYYMEISYTYKRWESNADRLMIDKFYVKNLENDDFIEMKIFDFTWSGAPILYVDLINGVVMEEQGAWKADQFITAIQDVFRLVKLPKEDY